MNDKKILRTRAANWGIILGGIMFLITLLGWALKLDMKAPMVVNFMNLAAIVSIIFLSGRMNVATRWEKCYDYRRSFGFILLTMLLGGVASGVGVFVMNAWVAPEYYAELMNRQIDTVLLQGRADDATIELMEKMRPSILHFMKNPFVWIVSSSCNLLFYGGLAGLVMASSLRQKEQTPSNNE